MGRRYPPSCLYGDRGVAAGARHQTSLQRYRFRFASEHSLLTDDQDKLALIARLTAYGPRHRFIDPRFRIRRDVEVFDSPIAAD